MMPNKHALLLFTAGLAFLSIRPASADTVVSTLSGWNGSDEVDEWGSGNDATPTYGQTFTVPADNVLDSVTVEIENIGSTAISYQPYVYAWSTATGPGSGEITGSALFTGAISTLPVTSGFQNITINTGNLDLQSGQQYVVFLTTTTSSTSGLAYWGALTTNPYSGGAYVYSNYSTFSGLTNPWDPGSAFDSNTYGSGDDIAFSLDFSSAPEPSTDAMMIGGLMLLAFCARRKLA
jgi:hypothetical protein